MYDEGVERTYPRPLRLMRKAFRELSVIESSMMDKALKLAPNGFYKILSNHGSMKPVYEYLFALMDDNDVIDAFQKMFLVAAGKRPVLGCRLQFSMGVRVKKRGSRFAQRAIRLKALVGDTEYWKTSLLQLEKLASFMPDEYGELYYAEKANRCQENGGEEEGASSSK